MKCANCLAEVPSQSVFCLRCGKPVADAGAGAPPDNGFSSLASGRRDLRPLAAAIALLTIVAAALGAAVSRSQLSQKAGAGASAIGVVQAPGMAASRSGLVQSPGASAAGGPLVQAPGQGGPNSLVQAPGESAPNNMVQSPGDSQPTPQDVVDYLAFVKQIDAQRIHMERDEIASGLATLPLAQSIGVTLSDEGTLKKSMDKIKSLPSQVANDWNNLTVQFNQRVPPDSCKELYNKYYEMLGKAQGMDESVTSDLNTAMSQIFQQQSDSPNLDVQALIKSLSNIQAKAPEVDNAAAAADQALADICSKFKLTKDFDIKGDPSGATLFQQ